MDPNLIPLEMTAQEQVQRRLAQLRRRMLLCVALAGLVGFGGFAAVLVVGKQRDINREHYEFRQTVRPGLNEAQVRERWGEPYRTFWTRLELGAVLSGGGRYKRFDFRDAGRVRWAHETEIPKPAARPPAPQTLPPESETDQEAAPPAAKTPQAPAPTQAPDQPGGPGDQIVVSKVLQYRPATDCGEFVLVGPDGTVVAVFTGRP